MADTKEHPVRALLRKRGLSQAWLLERLADVGVPISKGHLSGVLNRKTRPSWDVATAIAKIVGSVTPASIMDAVTPPAVPPPERGTDASPAEAP